MFMQQVNKSDTERIWANFTNSDGQTISKNFPVFKISAVENTASVSTNEAGSRGTVVGNILADAAGGFIGLCFEDVANGGTGVVQVYGYHESALVMRITGSVTVVPGHAIGPGSMAVAASIGFSSTGTVNHPYGPVVALDTITSTMHSLGTPGDGATPNFANHVFIRAL